MGIELETAERRNQPTTHANSSIRPSEQRVDRRLALLAGPRHYPQMRLSFGDSLETGFDDNPGATAGSVGYGAGLALRIPLCSSRPPSTGDRDGRARPQLRPRRE